MCVCVHLWQGVSGNDLTLTYIMLYLWLLSARGYNYAGVAAVVLATGTNASFLDRLYKNQATIDTYM